MNDGTRYYGAENLTKRLFSPVILAAVLLHLAGCSHPPDTGRYKQTSGGLTVALETQPSPPHSGDNTLILTITDATTGTPIGNANLTVSADMTGPNIRGMDVSGRAQGNGRYDVPVRLALAARYKIRVHIEQTGRKPVDVAFPVEAPH